MVSVKSHPKKLLWLLILAGSSLWWNCSEPEMTFEPAMEDFSQAWNKIWTLKLRERQYTNSSSYHWFSNNFLAIFDSTLVWRSSYLYSHRSYNLYPPILELKNGIWEYSFPQFNEPIYTHALYGLFTYHFEGNGMMLSLLDNGNLSRKDLDYTFVNEYRDTLSSAAYYSPIWQLVTVSDDDAALAMDNYRYELSFTSNHSIQLQVIWRNTPGSERTDPGIYGIMNTNQICLLPRNELSYTDDYIPGASKQNDLRLRYIIFQSREISLEGDSLLHLSSIYGETTFRKKS
ncbi:MAG: hypothetical protein K9N11_03490 [Lentisphaeria bacterium]|nr:hypothetical protein [Candidatus Neomarinimicrobiota bacterium]MCF7841898.1 hypothetical protein [Lentisphaeria bacterium]